MLGASIRGQREWWDRSTQQFRGLGAGPNEGFVRTCAVGVEPPVFLLLSRIRLETDIGVSRETSGAYMYHYLSGNSYINQ